MQPRNKKEWRVLLELLRIIRTATHEQRTALLQKGEAMTKLTRNEIASAYQRAQQHMTYPELDDLHRLYDYLCDMEIEMDTLSESVRQRDQPIGFKAGLLQEKIAELQKEVNRLEKERANLLAVLNDKG